MELLAAAIEVAESERESRGNRHGGASRGLQNTVHVELGGGTIIRAHQMIPVPGHQRGGGLSDRGAKGFPSDDEPEMVVGALAEAIAHLTGTTGRLLGDRRFIRA